MEICLIKNKYFCLIIISFSLGLVVINFPIIKYELIKRFTIDEYVKVFSKIYTTNHWKQGSGTGSNPTNAAPYIALLQQYIDNPRFHTIVDLGCGDWQIMRHITIPNNKVYKGYDVVRSIQTANRRKFAKSNVKFYNINNLHDFKTQQISGDLLIIKDVIQHWPNNEITYFLKNILPNFKYALITNSITPDVPVGTIPVNNEIPLGQFRPLRLMDDPFNWQNVIVLLEYSGAGLGTKQVLFYVNPKFYNPPKNL